MWLLKTLSYKQISKHFREVNKTSTTTLQIEKMSQKGSKQPGKGSIQQQPHINATPQKSHRGIPYQILSQNRNPYAYGI